MTWVLGVAKMAAPDGQIEETEVSPWGRNGLSVLPEMRVKSTRPLKNSRLCFSTICYFGPTHSIFNLCIPHSKNKSLLMPAIKNRKIRKLFRADNPYWNVGLQK